MSEEKQIVESFYTKVAGVTFSNNDDVNRQEILKYCRVGDNINLVPRPNEYDDNAVEIINTELGEQLGFLKSELSRKMYKWIKAGNDYKAEISEITGGENQNLGCNIHVKKYKSDNNKIINNNLNSQDKSINVNDIKKIDKEKTSQEKTEELQDKMQNAGQKMQKVGCLLTMLLTIPIVLTLFFGPFGFGLSIILIVLYFISKNKGE
ncbi:MAG: HIRAN domain-containing protein [Candidatus Muiribacteriota bacterium]